MCIYIIKYVYSFQRTHISVRHFVGVFVYAGTINRTPTAANELPKCCWRISISLRPNCDNILNKLQQHNIQKTKTILLQRKNHTFTRLICNTQITKTLRTLRECILNGLRMRGEHYTKCQQTIREISTYTHEMRGEQSVRRRGWFIVPASSTKTTHFDMQNITDCNAYNGKTQHHFREIRGHGHDKSAPTAANGLR